MTGNYKIYNMMYIYIKEKISEGKSSIGSIL